LPLARELGVSRKILHDWRKAWDLHGPSGLNRKRGPALCRDPIRQPGMGNLSRRRRTRRNRAPAAMMIRMAPKPARTIPAPRSIRSRAS
jgi:transposase-like protein